MEKTARQAMAERVAGMNEKIQAITKWISGCGEDIERDPNNWALVGNAGCVEELLSQITEFIGEE